MSAIKKSKALFRNVARACEALISTQQYVNMLELSNALETSKINGGLVAVVATATAQHMRVNKK